MADAKIMDAPTADGGDEKRGGEREAPPRDAGGVAAYAARALVLVSTILALAALYWPLFSMGTYGYADVIYLKLVGYEHFFWALFLVGVVLLLTLVLFDVGYWKGMMLSLIHI